MRKSDLIRENDRLDREADRQAEKILQLEAEVDRLSRPVATHAPEPRISHDAKKAILAVAFMLENRAMEMAINVGADLGEYQRLCQMIHDLRYEVDRAAGVAPDETARALYESLTEEF